MLPPSPFPDVLLGRLVLDDQGSTRLGSLDCIDGWLALNGDLAVDADEKPVGVKTDLELVIAAQEP